MNYGKTLSRDEVALILSSEIELYDDRLNNDWKLIFRNDKKRHRLALWVKGILFEDNAGELCTAFKDHVSAKQFNLYCKKNVSSIRVYRKPNEEELKEKMWCLKQISRLMNKDCGIDINYTIRGEIKHYREQVDKLSSIKCEFVTVNQFFKGIDKGIWVNAEYWLGVDNKMFIDYGSDDGEVL